jgi:hypothetical protein
MKAGKGEKRSKRVPCSLKLSPNLAEMLGAVRAAAGINAAPEAALADVLAAEKALRGELPNDLLGYWIATGRSLGALIDMTESVKTFYEAMADDDRAWRTLARRFAHVAFDDDYNPDEGPLCAVLGNEKSAKIVFWFLRKGDGWEPTFEDPKEPAFVSYVKWKHPDVDFGAKAEPVDVRVVDAIVPTAKRRVTHPKFGEGALLQEIPPDKVEIDFGPPHGLKKLIKGPWFDGA